MSIALTLSCSTEGDTLLLSRPTHCVTSKSESAKHANGNISDQLL